MQKKCPYLVYYNTKAQPKKSQNSDFEELNSCQKRFSSDLVTEIGENCQNDRAIIIINAQAEVPAFAFMRLMAAMENTAENKPISVCSALSCHIYELSPLTSGDEFHGTVAQLDNVLYLLQEASTFHTNSINTECFIVRNKQVLANLQVTPFYACTNLLVQSSPAKTLSLSDKKDTGNQKPLPAHALADLHWRIKRYLKPNTLQNAYPILDKKGVILHITMGWGGGVNKWIDDYAAHESDFHHIILASDGELYRQRHGESFNLHYGNTSGLVMQHYEMQAPIAATCMTHAEYKNNLLAIVQRYNVSTIIVSSLIGHSMDCLSTTLPTLRVLHDYFPSWPSLIANLDKNVITDKDLSTALAQTKQEPFGEIEQKTFDQWQKELHKLYQKPNISLIAPSNSVVKNLQKIDAKVFSQVEIIAHAIAKFPTIKRKNKAQKFTILILGRINPPKGQELLEAIMAKLGSKVKFVLLGAGNEGKKYLPLKNTQIIMDYANEDLAQHLQNIQADIALITSQTSETYNYTLSELQQAGICTLGTKYGALKERIKHGETGFLCEDNADDFVKQIKTLQANPKQIISIQQSLQKIKPFTFRDEIKAYKQKIISTTPHYSLTTQKAQLSVFAQQLLHTDRNKNRLAKLLKNSQTQLQERTNWAQELNKNLEKAAKDIALEQQEIKNLEEIIAHERGILKQETRRLTTEIKQINHVLDNETKRLNKDIVRLNKSYKSLDQKYEKTLSKLQQSEQNLHDTQFANEKLNQELTAVYQSRSWRATKPLRKFTTWARHKRNALKFRASQVKSLPNRTIRSLKTRGITGTIGLIKNKLSKNKGPQKQKQQIELSSKYNKINLATTQKPTVSIIIPVYNHFQHSYNCLHSISQLREKTPFEVIVIDDCSSDGTEKLIKNITGIRYYRQATNGGFITSCNRGAEKAKGQFLLFLNNDTVVYANWLDALIKVFNDYSDAGLVGSKLVYPDHQLQEAGGIVFSDASGWNYGRLGNPDEPCYNHVREVDYCSGASILIAKDLFEKLGRFDERYKPAYYEDTDLAFAVRRIGKKVYYQPASVITHFEGISSGTDLTQGMKKYQVVNQTKFKDKWKKELANQPKSGTEIELCRIHGQPKRILIFDACTPTPDQDSGSLRMLNLIKILKELGYHVIFMPENLSYDDNYTKSLQQLGVECIYNPSVTNPIDYLKEKGKHLDAVLLSRYYVAEPVMPFIREYCPKAQIIFDTVDLHYIRERRMAELAEDKKLAKMAEITRQKELAVAKACDVTLVVSPYEVEVLAKELPELKVKVLTNIHEIYGCRKSFSQRKDIMFIGGYQHTPNVDAVEWFVKEIFPLVLKKLPDLKFHIIGSKAPKHIQAMANDNIIFQGFVEDIEPVMDDIRIAVAPLRYGAGVKGKVNMSMSYGQPVVGTKVAVEGMYAQEGVDVLMAQTPQEFANQIVRLYDDEKLWNTISQCGLANVENYFSFNAAKKAIQGILND